MARCRVASVGSNRPAGRLGREALSGADVSEPIRAVALGFVAMPRVLAGLGKASALARARIQGRRPGVEIGRRVRFGGGVRCLAEDGGRITIGDDVEVGVGTTLAALRGGSLVVAERVFISGGCTVAAAKHVSIGRESLIAELVSIRDHDHDPAYAPNSGRRLQTDVTIGERVWIGAKASVVRGGRIGDDAVVGAHALVNREVPSAALAVGVPARVVRRDLR
jgi:acetyltransferase-like isoleucine patch superfamily enzyme